MLPTLPLEKILHSQGFGTRRECRALIRDEAVSVNGEPCDDPTAVFATANLEFTVYDEPWPYREKTYIVFNKPAHFECSHKPIHHPSIFGLLPPPLVLRGVQCVGRLDEDTTGLLLLSDDGQFIHRMSSPKWKVPKTYLVTAKHPVSDELIRRLKEGVLLHDESEPIVALACERVSEYQLTLMLAEGKYHQVKRMVAAAGNRVEQLQRIRIGNLALDTDLAEGEWRWLDPAEIGSPEAKQVQNNHQNPPIGP